MSAIGMRHLVFAPVTSETPGTSITYGSGVAVDHAVRGDVTLDWAEGTDYANDIVDDYYKRCTGGTVEVESTVWPDTVAELLGLEEETGSGSKIYRTLTSADAKVGFGFIQVLRENGTDKYRAWWLHKVTFAPGNVSAATMEQDLQWTHVSLTGKLWTVDLAGTQPEVMQRQDFTTETAAKTWLNGLAGVA